MADDFYPFVDSGDPAPDNRHITGSPDAVTVAEQGADEGEAREIASYATRISIYDDLFSTPRVVVIDPGPVRSYLEEVTNTVYRCMKEQGGSISLMVIREIVENFIHAHFMEPIISILDGGNTIRFADQGPGIEDKERAFEFGVTSANRGMKRYIRGTGSGFPMVQQYLEAAGGAVSIEDNLGAGTVVTVSVDPKRVEEIRRSSARGAAVRSGAPKPGAMPSSGGAAEVEDGRPRAMGSADPSDGSAEMQAAGAQGTGGAAGGYPANGMEAFPGDEMAHRAAARGAAPYGAVAIGPGAAGGGAAPLSPSMAAEPNGWPQPADGGQQATPAPDTWVTGAGYLTQPYAGGYPATGYQPYGGMEGGGATAGYPAGAHPVAGAWGANPYAASYATNPYAATPYTSGAYGAGPHGAGGTYGGAGWPGGWTAPGGGAAGAEMPAPIAPAPAPYPTPSGATDVPQLVMGLGPNQMPTPAPTGAQTPTGAASASGTAGRAPLIGERGLLALRFLIEQGHAGPTELADAYGQSGPTWSRELTALSRQGFVVKQGQKYYLTDLGAGWIQSHRQN